MQPCRLPRNAPNVFLRHEPEKTVLYQIVREHMNTFFEIADARAGEGRGLPRYVKNAFRRYLECGILSHGFARVRCPDCGYDAVVAFSCKERGICPSCSARLMSKTAAFLVDRVLPRVPVRQWVFSPPRPVRFILARDAKLLGEALRIFVGEIFRDLRRRAGVRRMRDGSCGSVTAVQRFGGALNLNIHFHSLVLDGVYVPDPASGTLRFRRLPPPSEEDLDRVLLWTRRQIREMLSRRGFSMGSREEGGAEEEAVGEPTALDALQGMSIQGMLGLAGGARRVPMAGGGLDEPVEVPEKSIPFCRTSGDGYNLEAGRRIRAGDQEGLEQLCRYVLRPSFSHERIERLADGRVMYRFRQPWPDGSTHLVLDPVEFLGKLAALVPPPRAHLVRYHGIFAPHAKCRRAVLAMRPALNAQGKLAARAEGQTPARDCPHRSARVAPCGSEQCSRPLAGTGVGASNARDPQPRAGDKVTASMPAPVSPRIPSPVRSLAERPAPAELETAAEKHRWRYRMRRADLLKRTLGVDVLECPRCRGIMKPIAEITEPAVVGRILRAMGLSDIAPRAAPARPPPQAEFDFTQVGS